MFAASDFDMPFRVETTSWGSGVAVSVVAIGAVWGDAAGACAGIGCGFGWIEVVRAMGWEPVVVGGSIGAVAIGSATTGAESTGAGGATGSGGAAGSAGALGSAGAEGGVGAGGVEEASIVVWW